MAWVSILMSPLTSCVAWLSYLASLCLRFLIYQLETTVACTLRAAVRNARVSSCARTHTVTGTRCPSEQWLGVGPHSPEPHACICLVQIRILQTTVKLPSYASRPALTSALCPPRRPSWCLRSGPEHGCLPSFTVNQGHGAPPSPDTTAWTKRMSFLGPRFQGGDTVD